MLRVFGFTLLFLPLWLAAEIAGFPFDNKQQEQRFRELAAELRCLVCQNQSLADSNASLAQDLRQELYQQVISNQTDNQIIDFMTQRYGDFILYKPRITIKTFVLWFAPLICLLTACFFLFRLSKAQQQTAPYNVSDEEREKIRSLLQQTNIDDHDV